jgi:predicted membrane-bound mannosyltransferase
LNRAGHGAAHFHPWYYYLDLLTWIEVLEWPGWNEDYTVVLAVVGLGLVFWKKKAIGAHGPWVRLLALYALFMVVLYSSLHYKTPWSILGALHGMILVAAVGTDQLLHLTRARWQRILLGGAIGIFGLASPAVQSVLLNFKYDADQTNPYVYAHTHRDIYEVCAEIRGLVDTGGEQTVVQVFCPGSDFWPLPWYLRDLQHLEFNDRVDENTTVGDIIVTQPDMEGDILRLVYEHPPPGQREMFVPLLDRTPQLRHGVPLTAYVRKSLWDRKHLVDALEERP